MRWSPRESHGNCAPKSGISANRINNLAALTLVYELTCDADHKSAKKSSAYDKPMTIETAVFLECPRDRPTGHPESSARGAGQHACGSQQPRMANLSATHSVSKLERQPRGDRRRRGWQSGSANGGSLSGRRSI